MRRLLRGFALGVVVWLLGSSAAHAEIKIGVQAYRGEKEALERWGELGKYVSAALAQPVTIVPLKVADFVTQVKQQHFDFVMTNPVQTVQLQELLHAAPLLSVSTDAGQQFAGLIIAKQGSGIKTASDLKGKKVMGLSAGSAGAYIFQAYHLLQRGIHVHKDCQFQQASKQDDLVLLVQKGVMDAGFVRTGTLEDMAKEGKVKMGDFEVVDPKTDDNFPLPHSTALYPDWYALAMPQTDAALVGKVKAALLTLTPTTEAAKVARIKGFVEPLPLEGLKQAMEALQIGLSEN